MYQGQYSDLKDFSGGLCSNFAKHVPQPQPGDRPRQHRDKASGARHTIAGAGNALLTTSGALNSGAAIQGIGDYVGLSSEFFMAVAGSKVYSSARRRCRAASPIGRVP